MEGNLFTSFIIVVAAGVIVAIAGYFLNLSAMRKERQAREKGQLLNAGRSILAELQTNLTLAKRPFKGRLIPFVISMWEAYKGEILRLPRDLQDALYQVYVEIQMTNALVQADLHKLEYGRGYYDKEYRERCNGIVGKVEEASKSLANWLNQEGVQVGDIGEKAEATHLKTFSLGKIRQRYPRAYEKWTDEENARLMHKYNEGLNIKELAEMFQRQPSAIRSRLRKLGLGE